MAMPNHLVLVRHGESEGNFVRSAHKKGDDSFLTPEFRERPGHEWRITPKGVEQAEAAGEWIKEHIIGEHGLPGFDRYVYSPHRRTGETAAHLGLPNAQWRLNRLLREREWGELAGMVEPEHKKNYPNNHKWMKEDPLHWAPPGGESISQVADNRVREFFDTLHRDHDEKDVQSVIGVTHGEFIWAARLVLDYMFNEDYEATEADKTQKIHNCQVVHYTRISPEDGTQSPYLRWRRSVAPWKTPGHTGEWHQSSRRTLSNDELLAQVESLPRLFGDDS
jgi:broad specificity phosphatase PhoE